MIRETDVLCVLAVPFSQFKVAGKKSCDIYASADTLIFFPVSCGQSGCSRTYDNNNSNNNIISLFFEKMPRATTSFFILYFLPILYTTQPDYVNFCA